MLILFKNAHSQEGKARFLQVGQYLREALMSQQIRPNQATRLVCEAMVGKKGSATKLLDIVFFKDSLSPEAWVFTDFDGYFVTKDISTLSLRDVVTSVLGSLIGSRSSQFSNEDLMVKLPHFQKSIEFFGSSKICCVAGHNTKRQLLNITELCRLNSLFKNGIDFFQLFKYFYQPIRVPNRKFQDYVYFYDFRSEHVYRTTLESFYTGVYKNSEISNSAEKIKVIKAGREIVTLVLSGIRESHSIRLIELTLLFIMEEQALDCWFIGAQNCALKDTASLQRAFVPGLQSQKSPEIKRKSQMERMIMQHHKFNKRLNRQKYLYLKNNTRFMKMTVDRSVSPLSKVFQFPKGPAPPINKSFNNSESLNKSLNNEMLRKSLHRILRASPTLDISTLPARRASAAVDYQQHPPVKQRQSQDELVDINPLDSRPLLPRLLMTNDQLLATIQTSSLKKVASHAERSMQNTNVQWRRPVVIGKFQNTAAARMHTITPDMIQIPKERKREPSPPPQQAGPEPPQLDGLLETFDNTKVRKALHKITPKSSSKSPIQPTPPTFSRNKHQQMRSTLGFLARQRAGANSSQELRATTSPSKARRLFSKAISDIFTEETPREKRSVQIDSPLPQNSQIQETINTRMSQNKYPVDFEMSQVTGSAITIQERQTTPKRSHIAAAYSSLGNKTRNQTTPRATHRRSAGKLEIAKEGGQSEEGRSGVMRLKRHTTYGNMLAVHDLDGSAQREPRLHYRASSLSKVNHSGSHLVLRMPSIAAEEVLNLSSLQQGSQREEAQAAAPARPSVVQ